MMIGKWSIDVMYGPGAQEDTEIVFLPDGTGWIAFFHYELCELETFRWRNNENGSIRISGEIYQTIGEPQEKSNLEMNELFYTVKLENTPSGEEMKVITFSKPIWCNEQKFGLLTDNIENEKLPSYKNEAESIKQLIQFLHLDTPEIFQNEAIEKLKHASEEYLDMLIQPFDKSYWDNAAVVLSSIDHQRLKGHIPSLLMWLQDMNWPGAEVIAKILVEMRELVIPHLRPVLLGNDKLWIYWILIALVKHWPTELILELKDELIILSNRQSQEEIDVIANEILIQHRLL
ncbi:DUF5071 domain-containing protein [Brevibacillus brevis]|uniref:DUF5071 domain-containing protein n=1 Tax=Brevibacillus brevis TaxID=1393 RepID=UPI000E36A7BB|nr:DUF5071 domain-containing protein [Brevibacillus brevis]RED30113.1 uncharacterized protein DUF5071 [Brevibacillus brevis]VEF88660.1 Uncharacterised protein [Brevibacillus brevis]